MQSVKCRVYSAHVVCSLFKLPYPIYEFLVVSHCFFNLWRRCFWDGVAVHEQDDERRGGHQANGAQGAAAQGTHPHWDQSHDGEPCACLSCLLANRAFVLRSNCAERATTPNRYRTARLFALTCVSAWSFSSAPSWSTFTRVLISCACVSFVMRVCARSTRTSWTTSRASWSIASSSGWSWSSSTEARSPTSVRSLYACSLTPICYCFLMEPPSSCFACGLSSSEPWVITH